MRYSIVWIFSTNPCQLFLRFIVTFLLLLAWSRIGFDLLVLPWVVLPIRISISGIAIIRIWAAILSNGIFPQKFNNATRLIGEIVVWLIHVSHLSYENILTDDLNNLQMYKSVFTWHDRNQDYACKIMSSDELIWNQYISVFVEYIVDDYLFMAQYHRIQCTRSC